MISWVGTLPDATFLLYEQILPYDPFGKTMIQNLKYRGCELQSIETYPEREDQMARFNIRGFINVDCWDMNDIYYHLLEKVERIVYVLTTFFKGFQILFIFIFNCLDKRNWRFLMNWKNFI